MWTPAQHSYGTQLTAMATRRGHITLFDLGASHFDMGCIKVVITVSSAVCARSHADDGHVLHPKERSISHSWLSQHVERWCGQEVARK